MISDGFYDFETSRIKSIKKRKPMSALRETGRSESSTRTLVIQDLEMGKKMREIILTQEEEQKKLARKKDKKA